MPPARPIADGLFTTDAVPRLVAARCSACTRLQFPAATTCPYCGGLDSTATLVGPEGWLRLYTVVASTPPGYRGPLPFGFGVVELADTGLQVIARLTESRMERLRPGLQVRLVVEPLFTEDDGTAVLSYAFAPDPERSASS